MEVHHHTHSARKRWTHYFWEFFMLFLAVFAGFMAENWREHMIEHKRARELAGELLHLDVVQSVALEDADQLLLEVMRPKEFFGPLAEVITRHGHDLQRLQVIDATTEAVFDYLMQAAHYHH